MVNARLESCIHIYVEHIGVFDQHVIFKYEYVFNGWVFECLFQQIIFADAHAFVLCMFDVNGARVHRHIMFAIIANSHRTHIVCRLD